MNKVELNFSPFNIASEIWIGKDIALPNLTFFKNISKKRCALITDKKVESLWGLQLRAQLRQAGYDVELFSCEACETAKSHATKQRIEEQMFSSGFCADTCVIALGGGMIMDLAGFIAATYCRGVPLVCIPTTLLAMVDASIGGKTAINTAHGKNLIGAFYPAHLIVIDTAYLNSLHADEIKNGMAEVIKYGLIASRPLFEKLQSSFSRQEIIQDSCQIKCQIAASDPQEIGARRTLNFGHTFAHALEKVQGYRIPHGQAVLLGLLFESFLSYQLHSLSHTELDCIVALVQRYISCDIPIDFKLLCAAMLLDKKALAGVPRFVLLNGIGKTLSFGGAYCTAVDINNLKEACEWLHTTTASAKVT